MNIRLRLEKGWSELVTNTGVNGKFNCDRCSAKLYVAPHGGKYCDEMHFIETAVLNVG